MVSDDSEDVEDPFFDLPDPPEMTDEEWAAHVGTPPDWFYLLIGRVSVEAVRLDYYLVAVALQAVHGAPPDQHEILDVLTSSSAIREAIKRATAFDSDLSAALRAANEEARRLAAQRNSYVHGFVEWGDVEFQYLDPRTGRLEWGFGEGWYKRDPKPHSRTKGGKPLRPEVALTAKLKAEMEQTLADLQALSDRVFGLSDV